MDVQNLFFVEAPNGLSLGQINIDFAYFTSIRNKLCTYMPHTHVDLPWEGSSEKPR